MTRRHLIRVGRQEIKEWSHKLPPGLALAILFAYVHRLTTGETVEETFFQPADPIPDYEI